MVKMTKNSAMGGLWEPIIKQCYLEISAVRGSAVRGIGVLIPTRQRFLKKLT